jgi:Na+/phosphate symporter
LPQELGKPGISTEEATLEKLTNMRNQLLEIQDLAVSMLETPEKFTTAQVTVARQDVRRLSPLIENYDRAIMNFETSLNPNKPDPAMFESR